MPLAHGDRLGPYEIVGLLGKGGMGEVYRARDTRLGRDVALKVSAEKFSERFAREAHAVAALNHPNICTLHDVGPDYLVMELVEGETLDEVIRGGPVAPEEAIRIARQIAAALEEAHSKGITHRDLKPSNIKLKPDGSVKVLDFGLAKLGDPPAAASEDSPTLTMRSPTEAGVILGTAAYMAPEQARGKRVDKRADIWAFGVVLFEMLTGRRLFQGETVSDVLAAVLERQPDFNQVPPSFRTLLRRCLERDAQKRLRDIGDAMPLVEDGPAETAAAKARPWKIVAASVAFAFIGAAATWLAFHFTPRPDPPLIRLSVDLGLDAYVAPLAYNAISISPDGSRIVYHGRTADGKPMLASRQLNAAS